MNVFLLLTRSAPGESLSHLRFRDNAQPLPLCGWGKGRMIRQVLSCKPFRLFTSCSLVRDALLRITEV